MLDRDALIDLVENQYFGAMDCKDLDATMAALHPDCVFTIYASGDRFAGRDGAIRPMFERAFRDYESLWHGDFHWTVDESRQELAGRFRVKLVRTDGGMIEMSNGKFFDVRDGKLVGLELYLSTSEAIVGDAA